MSADPRPDSIDPRRELTAEELERRSNFIRADVDLVLAELSDRLSPAHLRRVAIDELRSRGLGLASTATRALRNRPKTATLLSLAAGVACGALLRRRNGHSR